MFESKLNKDLVKYFATCFGLLQFADILINRSLIPDISINILLFISVGGFFIIIIKNYLQSVKTETKTKSNINLKTSILIISLFLVSISNIIFIGNAAKIKKLNQDLIPKIKKLVNEGNYFDSFLMIDDTVLISENFPEVLNSFSALRNINSEPIGAKVFYSKNTLDDEEEYYIGETPLTNIRLPRGAIKLKFTKDGFKDRLILSNFGWTVPFKTPTLSPLDNPPMIYIDSSLVNISIAGLVETDGKITPGYLIDENETTNNEYFSFLNSSEYSDPYFWDSIINKHSLANFNFNEIEKFIDKTGRQGPSTWSIGKFETGKENYPVLGISWFEALAYCEFKGKTLPNIYQWDKAAGMASANYIIPESNIFKTEPVDIYSSTSVGYYGLKHMAGNAREWIYNTSGKKDKFILGGGYSDEIYLFNWVQSANPFDRSNINGCRCAEILNNNTLIGYEPILRPTKDLFSLFGFFNSFLLNQGYYLILDQSISYISFLLNLQ